MAESNIVEQEEQLVVFSLFDEEFGLDIKQVREIIKLPSITKLPHVSSFIEGVTNIRGDIIPVISLRKRFSIADIEASITTRVIIVDLDNSQVGLIVDAVTEVLRLPQSAIEPPPRSVAGLKAEYLKGVGKIDDRLIILLEVNKILTTDEQIELKDMGESLEDKVSAEEVQ